LWTRTANADTLAAGRGSVRESAARVLCDEAPGAVADLAALGVSFDADRHGSLALGLEGGHSARRIVHAGGAATGRRLIRQLSALAAEDPRVALDLWDHLAAWYAVETGLDNSTLLGPAGPSDYVFVNHARWDMSLPRFAVTQFGKRTFYSYVLANLHANGTASMSILYRLA